MPTIDDEITLEKEMYQLGADRYVYRNQMRVEERMESMSHYGTVIVEAGLEPLAQAVLVKQEAIKAGRPGSGNTHMKPLMQQTPWLIAAVAMRTCVDQISTNRPLYLIATDLADKLWIEVMLARATSREMLYFNDIRGRRSRKKEDIMRMQHTTLWSTKELSTIGLWLVLAVIKVTGLMTIVKEWRGRNTIQILAATPKVLEYIKDATTTGSLLCPHAMPMIVPPRPWNKDLDGGYYSFIPDAQLCKDYLDEISAVITGREPFIQAANLQQAVPWQINAWLLPHIEHAWERGLQIGKLLPREGWEVPPYPKHLADDHPDVQQWRWDANHIHDKNKDTLPMRVAVAKMIWIANRFKDYKEIYFPTQLDFRGRFYYRPPFLNPQGNDIARSLLNFANGSPIVRPADGRWLEVHIANTFGHGKLNWDQRVAWVHENKEKILQSGDDPWGAGYEFWTAAKDPWQFLASCNAYAQYKTLGDEYICQLPVVLDCTCSGIQHYSALLRSEKMGQTVNLTTTDSVADVYSLILEKVLAVLRIDAAAGNEMAIAWLTLSLDRTLLKPIVMTIPYSASRFGHVQQIKRWTYERTTEMFGHKDNWRWKENTLKAVHYLTTIVIRESDLVVAPAKQAMEWFKAVGYAGSSNEKPLHWVTPAGLPVYHKYTGNAMHKVRLRYLTDVHVKRKTEGTEVCFYNGEESWSPQRMANALSPNVIHSLDGSHMAFVVLDAAKNGVKNIGGIHDCFATLPSDMEALRNSVRNTFAKMYTPNVFKQVTTTLLEQLTPKQRDKIPRLPKQGNLNVADVRNSNYFIT